MVQAMVEKCRLLQLFPLCFWDIRALGLCFATDQATAVIDLFDGEIELTQTEDPLECKKSIRVKKLGNQDYIKNPICLT